MSDLWEKIYTERLFECTFIYTSQGQTEMLEDKVHGGDSHDFKTTTMADTIEIINSVTLKNTQQNLKNIFFFLTKNK